MKISIIIPIYNGEKYIERCLYSVQKQTYKDFEVLLIDDGSTDNSKKICKQFVERDNRFLYFYKNNGGAGTARNFGLEKCSGEYVVFPDCDDWVDERYLEILYNQMIEMNLDLCICNSRHYDNDGTTKKNKKKYYGNDIFFQTNESVKENYLMLLKLGFVQGPSDKIYRMSIIKENNLKFPALKRSQDVVFNLDYLNFVNRFKVSNIPLYNYCMGDMTSKVKEGYLDIVYVLCLRWNKMKCYSQKDRTWDDYLVNYISGSINLTIRYLLNKNLSNRNLVNNLCTESYDKLKEFVRELYPSNIKGKMLRITIIHDSYLILLLKIILIKYKK